MNSLIRGVLWSVITFLGAVPAQGNTSINQISSIEVKDDFIQVTGRSKPNFTTFSLSEPPRLVVDISEAVFAKQVPAQLSGSGKIAMVKTATYGSDSATIARIIITFREPLETDISVIDETILRVKVIEASVVAPKVSAVETPTHASPPSQVAVAEDEEEEESSDEDFEDTAASESEESEESEEPSASKPEASHAEVSEPKATQEGLKAQEAEEEKRRLEEAKVAREAEKQKAAEEKARKQAEALATREAEKARAAEALTEKKRLAEEERLRKEQEAEERRRLAAEEKSRQEEAAVARREAAKAEAEAAAVTARAKTLQFLGFKVDAAVSRLSFRTNEPVHFSLRQEDEKKWVVELENTFLGSPRNGLPLDTSFFDSPVVRITPSQGSGRRLLAEIALKEPARVRTQQAGNEVYVEFERM